MSIRDPFSSPDFTPFKPIRDARVIIIVKHHWLFLFKTHMLFSPVRSPDKVGITPVHGRSGVQKTAPKSPDALSLLLDDIHTVNKISLAVDQKTIIVSTAVNYVAVRSILSIS